MIRPALHPHHRDPDAELTAGLRGDVTDAPEAIGGSGSDVGGTYVACSLGGRGGTSKHEEY